MNSSQKIEFEPFEPTHSFPAKITVHSKVVKGRKPGSDQYYSSYLILIPSAVAEVINLQSGDRLHVQLLGRYRELKE